MKPTTLAAAMMIAAAPLAAQTTIADRVAAVREGTVRMHFAARPGVCGDGRGNVWTQGRNVWNDGRHVCIAGPVIVRIDRADNQTVRIRKTVGGPSDRWPMDTDLGGVPARDAALYLLTLAHSLAGSSAEEALGAAAFADAGDLSSQFLAVVRDDNAPIGTRRQALFWFGQSDAPTSQLTNLYGELRASSLREQYPFVLSQRHDDAAVDKLIEVARTDRDVAIRKQAMFWLGQSKDPKAVKFLRDLILR
jgi:hypothetical protein